MYADALALTPLLFVDYDTPDAEPASGRRYFVFADHRGTPVLIEDDAGRAVWRASIEPYGRARVSETSSIAFCSRFPGHYHDPETGLHYNRFRVYSPELGRYLQPDPYGIAGGLNLYAYAEGRPLVAVDVRGLACPKHAGKRDDECEDCDNAKKAKKKFEEHFEDDPDGIFKKDMDPNRKEGVDKYSNGEVGNSVRDLDLSGKTPAEIDAILQAKGIQKKEDILRDFSPKAKAEGRYGEPIKGPDGQPIKKVFYTHDDGGTVRVKPDGHPGQMGGRDRPHASTSGLPSRVER